MVCHLANNMALAEVCCLWLLSSLYSVMPLWIFNKVLALMCLQTKMIMFNDWRNDQPCQKYHFYSLFPWYHRRAVAQPCVNGDQLSQWRMAKFDPCRSKTSQPTDTKFETGDYVREATLCVKFHANPSIGGFSAKGWNIMDFLKFPYSVYPF